MKVWTVILAGVLLAALPNLGSGALEDVGVIVTQNYTKFERRVWPARTLMLCYYIYGSFDWFRIPKLEQILLDFENGKNLMNATFSRGTPTILFATKRDIEFRATRYCRYLPKAYRNQTWPVNEKMVQSLLTENRFQYFAVKINNTERATIKKGWNYLLNVVKKRFPDNKPSNYLNMVVEKTAAGVIYVGVAQDLDLEPS